MKKRAVLCMLTALLVLSLAAPASARGESAPLRGADYTDIPELAEKLDRVFAGSPVLYSDIRCRTPVRADLNTGAVPPGTVYYVRSAAGEVYSGTSCYIYANAVYAALFGDVPCHGDDVGWINSECAAKNLSAVSFDGFRSLGVRFGALVRTTSNPDGSYNGNYGHSVILLAYDSSGLTYLEGNGDGRGLVRAVRVSWDEFNRGQLWSRSRRICFIVQPTAEYMASLAGETGLVGSFARTRAVAAFRDVPPDAWYASGVAFCCQLGILNGRSADTFAPAEPVTVAEGVAVCAKFLSRCYDDGRDFTSDGVWYGPFYDYCRIWGIGVDFAEPETPIRRADFVRLMSRALPDSALTPGDPIAFPDVPPASSFAGAVRRMTATGVILGSNGLFRPDSTLTRAEMAQIVARMADRDLRGK